MFGRLLKRKSVPPQWLRAKPQKQVELPPSSAAAVATPCLGLVTENLRDFVRTAMGAVPEIDDRNYTAIFEAALRCLKESRGQNLAILGEAVSAIEGLAARRRGEICQLIIRPAAALLDNQRRLAAGITHAIWVASGGVPCGDGEMTARHGKLDGKRYRIDTGLLVGKQRLFPGVEPGCRCTSAAVID